MSDFADSMDKMGDGMIGIEYILAEFSISCTSISACRSSSSNPSSSTWLLST